MTRKKPVLATRLRLLALLAEHDKLTGAAAIEHDPTIPSGTVYTTLRRLEREKLVKSWQDDTKGLPGHPRRFYKITQRGRRFYQLGADLAKLLQWAA
jgi:DNA-binding PadR family transcriptional regulator